MLTGILNSGFGHSVRFIALTEHLRKHSNITVNCLAPQCMKKYLSENISQYGCKLYNLNHLLYLSNNMNHKKKVILSKDKKIIQHLKRTSVVMNDFITQTHLLNHLFENQTIFCSLYHGDITVNKYDSHKTASFKKTIVNTVNNYDIFFHINIQKPKEQPKMKCMYIPIPIISRQISTSAEKVKSALGLAPDEHFILVHAGSAVMENVYKDLYKFYEAVNHLKTDYRIVISSTLENNNYPFNKYIIKAPLFYNGIDLVNASDLVISKPGMGILQDCIATKKPLLFLPGDFAERTLKVRLLNEILNGNLPVINTISTNSLKEAIMNCIHIKHIYEEGYSKIPTNGAEILAKSLLLLLNMKKERIRDNFHLFQEINPFM